MRIYEKYLLEKSSNLHKLVNTVDGFQKDLNDMIVYENYKGALDLVGTFEKLLKEIKKEIKKEM